MPTCRDSKRSFAKGCASSAALKDAIMWSRRAGSETGIEIGPVAMVRGREELEAAFASAVKERADAVVLQASLPSKRVVELAIAHRLPAATSSRAFVEIGGRAGADPPLCELRTAVRSRSSS